MRIRGEQLAGLAGVLLPIAFAVLLGTAMPERNLPVQPAREQPASRSIFGEPNIPARVLQASGGGLNEAQKLYSSSGTNGERFGALVDSISATTDRALIGDRQQSSEEGAAYVFDFAGGSWSEAQKLTASDQASGDAFGSWVWLDGDEAMVGAYQEDNGNGLGAGSIYVYELSGGSWSETQKLVASNGASNDHFGMPSFDGNQAIIGAYRDDNTNGTDAGAAYVFEKVSGSWTESQILTAANGTADEHFGTMVRLLGTRAVIGAYKSDTVAQNAGEAYVFELSSGSWTEVQELTASDGAAGDVLSRELDYDGSRIVLGASRDDDNGSDSGSFYVYELSSGSWTETQKLTASDGEAGDRLSEHVSIDGSRIVAGATSEDTLASRAGAAYVYELSSGSWTETQKIYASDGEADDQFGWSISVVDDEVLIGAAQADGITSTTGAVYWFSLLEADLSLTKNASTTLPYEGDTITYTLTTTNSGPDLAPGVTVSETLPISLTFVSASGTGSYSDTLGQWDIGSLGTGAGNAAQLVITATVDSGAAGATITNTAQVASSNAADPDSTPGNNVGSEDDQDNVTFTVVAEADLALAKSVSDPAPYEGDTISYTLELANTGPGATPAVTVTDQLPTGLTHVADDGGGSYDSSTGLWSVGALDASGPGATAQLVITATVDAGTGDSILTNTAEVTASARRDPDSTPGNGDPDEDDLSAVDISVLAEADLSLAKSVSDPSPYEGDTIAYTLDLSNAGTGSTSGVTVVDLLPGGLSHVDDNSGGSYDPTTGLWDAGSLDASGSGASAQLVITASVDMGTGGSTISNSAEVESSARRDPDSSPGNNEAGEDDQDAVDIAVLDTADVSLTKTVDAPTPYEGETVAFTLEVVNAGPGTTTGVSVTDLLPAGLSHVADDGGGAYDSATGLWDIGALAASGAGATARLIITATLDAGTGGSTLANSAELTASTRRDPDSTPGNGVASEDDQDAVDLTVLEEADLSLTKTVDEPAPYEGDTVVYTLDLGNAGPGATAGVTVTDALPTGLSHVADDGGGAYDPSTGLWSVGSLDASGPGATAQLVITATVDAGTGGSTLGNSAEITSADRRDPDSTPGNDIASEDDQDAVDITVLEEADLSLSKSVSEAEPYVGDTIVYTLDLINAGPGAASGITVSDALPAGSSHVADSGGGAYDPSTGLWAVGSLDASGPGASAQLLITATVDAGTGGATITNSAEVTASNRRDPDSTPDNDLASEDDQDGAGITVLEEADLSLAKSVDDPAPDEGDTVVFALTASNAGPGAASGVTVSDALPAGLSHTSDDGAGAYDPTTGLWDIGSLDASGPGATAQLLITATVDTGTGGSTLGNSAELTAADRRDPDSTPGNGIASEDDQAAVDVDVRPLADVALSKAVSQPEPYEGDTVVFTLDLVNAGPGPADGLVVRDLLPAGLSHVADDSGGSYDPATGLWDIGSLAASGSAAIATLAITATVDAGTAGSSIDNAAELTAADRVDPDSSPDNNDPAEDDQASTGLTVLAEADLSLSKSVDEPAPYEGDTLRYTLAIVNDGPGASSGVAVTDLLPAGLDHVDDDGAGSYDPATGLWSVGSLDASGPGATAQLVITASVDAGSGGSTLTNSAAITAADRRDPDSAPDNDIAGEDDQDAVDVRVLEEADLALTKSVDLATPYEGDSIVYTLELSNAGPGAAAGLTAMDLLPAGLSHVGDDGGGAYDPVTGLWDVGSLSASGSGASAQLNITAIVDAGTGGSTLGNSAALTAADRRDPDSTPGNDVIGEDDQDAVDISVLEEADLSLSKSVDLATPYEGDTVVFTLEASNAGPGASSDIFVTGPLPAGLSHIADDGGGSYDPASGLWSVGTLDASGPGASVQLVVTATLDAGTPA